MKKLACLLAVFSLGMFVVGCGAKDEKKEEKKEETKKDGAGGGVKVEGGNTKEVNPDDIQLGKPQGGDDDKPEGTGGKVDPNHEENELENALPTIDPPQVDPPAIAPPAIDESDLKEPETSDSSEDE